MVEMLAWCGAALSCLLSVPQAIRVLRAERLTLRIHICDRSEQRSSLGHLVAAHRRIRSGYTGRA